MKDLKIRVADEAESKEVQELLDILGYSKDAFDNKSTPCWIAICDGLTYSDYNIGKNIWYTACPKEITIQELRDMVNPMKEYLEKQADGSYKLVMRGIVGKDDDIEVPEGAEIYTKNDADGNVFYRKGLDFLDHFDNKWLPTKYSTNGFIEEMKRNGRTVLWQREKKSIIDKLVDENLPEFKHDFCTSSLNDQYAEIEQVRKHRHYFKDVSNIAEIDVYAVLKLFDVTDPCLQHIVKKALCAGKRGYKDMMEDLQNIVDTAIRAVELNS